MKLKNFNNFLMYALIFFIIFASALNYTYLPASFSYIKDMIIFYFGILLVGTKKMNKPRNLGFSFYILFLLLATISWLGLLNNTENSPVAIVNIILRYLEFFILFFIFTNIEKICTVSYYKLIKLYISLSIILVGVNIIGYFVPNPIVSIYIDYKIGNGYYRNRISVGQPAIAVYPMIISFIFLLVYKKNTYTTMIMMIILLFGIIISTSTTGILSITISMIIFIFLNTDQKNRRKYCIFFIVLTILGLIILKIITSIPTLNELYEKQMDLLDIKISALFNENINDLSMDTRKNKFEIISKNINNELQKIFGVGLWGYNANGINVGSLENTYIVCEFVME